MSALYDVTIEPRDTFGDREWEWSVSLAGEGIGEGTANYRWQALRDAKRTARSHSTGKPNTHARQFKIRV